MTDALAAASKWYVTLHAPDVSDDERSAFAHWQAASQENANAWQRIVHINQQFADIDPALGKATLRQKQSISLGRRRALKHLGVILTVGTASYTVYRQQPWEMYMADYSTKKGESQTVALADNTAITLNTDTAINTEYSTAVRQITLLQGEIHINTGHGAGSTAPFRVKTRDGSITALGTRFGVRQYADYISVNVFEGMVELAPTDNQTTKRLQANQAATFTASGISKITTLPLGAGLWVKGILATVNMPLKDFLAELSRYHTGFLQCDDAVAQIAVSGSFPLNDIPAILDVLTHTYPIRMQAFTRYWLTFKPA